MENKTLNTIQIIAKIGKILSKIANVFCSIGFVGCIIGIISLYFGFAEGIKVGNVTVYGLAVKSSGMTDNEMFLHMVAGLIFCLGGAILTQISYNYFKHELIAGTPFTMDGSKELLRLGICSMVIPLVTLVLAEVAYAVVNQISGLALEGDYDISSSISLGVMYIVLSLFCKYGAEKEWKEKTE